MSQLPLSPSDQDLLRAAGYGAYEDLVAQRLPGIFYVRDPASSEVEERTLRREMLGYVSGLIPAARMISWLGPNPRLQPVYGPESALWQGRGLAGMDWVAPCLLTEHDACVAAVGLIKQARPGRRVVYVADTLAPAQRFLWEQLLQQAGFEYRELVSTQGHIVPTTLTGLVNAETAAVLVASPNFFGCFEAMSDLGQLAHQQGALLGACVEAWSLCAAKTPAEYRANFCLLNGESIGLGWQLHTQAHLADAVTWRETPAKAEAPEEAIPFAWQRDFEPVWKQAHYLAGALEQIPGCKLAFTQPFFREFVVTLAMPARELAAELEEQGIMAGIPLQRWGYAREWLKISVHADLAPADLDYALRAVRNALARHSGKSLPTDH